MKKEDEIYTSYVHEKILEKLDKNKLQEIFKKRPKRTKTTLNDLITYLKISTNKMNEFEKAYIIFYWLHENIEYDIAKREQEMQHIYPMIFINQENALVKDIQNYINILDNNLD